MRTPSGLPWVWGATPAEADAEYPCAAFADEGSVAALRAVTVRAPAQVCFVWLCQLRRAPYSYDLIDNRGRRSPRTADPALTHLRLGIDVMKIFTLVAFEPGRSLTLRVKPGTPTRLFGGLAITYALVEQGAHTRLICALALPPIGRHLTGPRRTLLAWGDLVMMRKQLRVLAALAERDAAATGAQG